MKMTKLLALIVFKKTELKSIEKFTLKSSSFKVFFIFKFYWLKLIETTKAKVIQPELIGSF